MMNSIQQSEQKVLAAKTAVETLFAEGAIFSGMKIGLGTGSTAMPAVEAVAELVRAGKLTDIKAVVTSFQTSIACERLGIPVYSLNSAAIGGELDLAIDGADEIDPECHLIKGGGAALLLEKLVGYNARRLVIVADSTKEVSHIGTGFAVPVEIIGEARVSVMHALQRLGASCVLREGIKKCGPVITDNGNMILDCHWQEPIDPAKMEIEINGIVGVVENGLFTRIRPTVFIAHGDGSVEQR